MSFVKPNSHQMAQMVKFMEQNPALARNQVVLNEDQGSKYEELALQLNTLGPPMRTRLEWKQVWFNLIRKVKVKVLANKRKNELMKNIDDHEPLKLNANEIAVKKLIIDEKPVHKPSKLVCTYTLVDSDSSLTWPDNMEDDSEVDVIKTEPTDFTVVTDATNELKLVTTTLPPSECSTNQDNTAIASPPSNMTNGTEKCDDTIRKELNIIKRKNRRILDEIAEIKQRDLELKGKLQYLKERSLDLKCQHNKFKAQKMELKQKLVAIKEATKLRNSINSKFKKIF